MVMDDIQNFEEMCTEMVDLLKNDSLPVVLWGNVSKNLYFHYFEKNGIVVDHICDRIKMNSGGG